MLILLNDKSCGGNAASKWETFINNYDLKDCTVIKAEDGNSGERISYALSNGETDYAAAGGDGTVNFLLNKLMCLSNASQIHNLRLGAIGLGSSNDFHKPYSESNLVEDIPYKLNFSNSELRDVGELSFQHNGERITRYFIINASIGITAEGNFLFNNPDRILKYLKRLNTNSAIIYSALKTIFEYKDFETEIRKDGGKPTKVNITNLNIIKNPNVSGDLCYGYPAVYNDGKMNIHLAHDMNKFEVIQLFRALQKGSIERIANLEFFPAKEIEIISDKVFNLEYDGEVVQTNSVLFSIKKEWIKVCKC
jgi:diacylglycerol kinase family enzyme